jgi:glycosyltransferase involved in cell wall biosynthesis
VVHNPADHDAHFAQRLAARSVLGGCQGLFTHAESLAGLLRHDYPSIPVSSHPLAAPEPTPLPSRLSARQRLGLPESPRIGLFLGLIRPYKGVDVLLQALTLADQGWHAVIAGETWGDLSAALPGQAKRLGVNDRVHFRLGWVPQEQIDDYLAAADIVVLPYYSCSQSGVATLALGRGRPVMTTRVGGLPEIIQDGVNGLLVERGDAEGLAAALNSLDSATIDELTAAASPSVARFTWASYARAVENLMTRIVP